MTDERTRIQELERAVAERDHVIQGFRRYVEVWQQDKRMKVMAGILLKELDRLEAEAKALSK